MGGHQPALSAGRGGFQMAGLIEAEVEGVLFRYDPEAGRLWRWVKRQGRQVLETPYWRETALSTGTHGYPVVHICPKLHLAHRVAWRIAKGYWPTEVDHINRDRKDFRLANLEDGTHASNLKNCKPRTDNTSGITGVYWSKKCRQWVAQICVDGKVKSLGLYPSKEAAAAARKLAEIKNGFHPNHGKPVTS